MNDELSIVETGLLVPVASLDELKAAYEAKQAFVDSLMKEGTDYGVIPGTGKKPTLLKAGAEKVAKLYGMRVLFFLIDSVEDWNGSDHDNEMFFYYRYRCDWVKNGEIIASSEASCNSWEDKYRYRTAKPVCPTCSGVLRKSRDNDGYYCWVKTGGCGGQFGPDVLEGQSLGKIKNPNPAEVVNTIQKMAQKRALVSNALIVGDLSDSFSQDLEDMPVNGSGSDPAAKKKAPAKRKPAAKKKAPAKQAAASSEVMLICDAVVKAGLAQNDFAAKGALDKCSTGWATEKAAIKWMRIYRGWRDLGNDSNESANLANLGEVPGK